MKKLMKKLKFWHGLVIGIVTAGLLAMLLVWQLPKPQKKYGYVDVRAVMQLIFTDLKDRNMQQKDMKRMIEEQREYFIFLLEDYSEKNNYVLFSAPKPIGGADDITDLFLKQMQISLENAKGFAVLPDGKTEQFSLAEDLGNDSNIKNINPK